MKTFATNFKWTGYLPVFAGLILLGACGSTKPPPTAKMSQSESAIKQAEQVGAEDYAPLALREARQKFSAAQKHVKQEEYEQATRLADEAIVNAELAAITARSEKAQEAVRQLRKSIRILKEEIQRNQQRQ